MIASPSEYEELRESELSLKSDNYTGGGFSSSCEPVFFLSGFFLSLSFAADLGPDFVAEGSVDGGDFFSGLIGLTGVSIFFLLRSSLRPDVFAVASCPPDFAEPPPLVPALGELKVFTGCEEEEPLLLEPAGTALAGFARETTLTSYRSASFWVPQLAL